MATDRLVCTVDGCGWFHDDDGPGPVESWPKLPAVDLTDYIRQATRLHLQRIEAVIADHLATHTPIEYLRTIQRLSQRVAALELLRDMDAEGGPVTEAELEELRKVWPPTARSDESTTVDRPPTSV